MPVKFKTEQEMAEVVIKHLERTGWEVWQEVQIHPGTPIADIVARKEDETIIVECKRSFGYRLISDGMNWLGYADRVCIAYPMRKFGDKRTERAAAFMINLYNLEEWKVTKDYVNTGAIKYQKNRNGKEQLLGVLCDEHKEWAKAGSQNARRVSDFQITCAHLEKYVRTNPGITLKEAVPEIAHHYAHDNSALGALSKLIASGDVRGIKCEGVGRNMNLYPEK